jgi:hypothetical protein
MIFLHPKRMETGENDREGMIWGMFQRAFKN